MLFCSPILSHKKNIFTAIKLNVNIGCKMFTNIVVHCATCLSEIKCITLSFLCREPKHLDADRGVPCGRFRRSPKHRERDAACDTGSARYRHFIVSRSDLSSSSSRQIQQLFSRSFASNTVVILLATQNFTLTFNDSNSLGAFYSHVNKYWELCTVTTTESCVSNCF